MAPILLFKMEKRMLQEAVDALIDNGRRGRPCYCVRKTVHQKSLSHMTLKGNKDVFRQNLFRENVSTFWVDSSYRSWPTF